VPPSFPVPPLLPRPSYFSAPPPSFPVHPLPYMYALCVLICLICMPYMYLSSPSLAPSPPLLFSTSPHFLCPAFSLICLICKPYMYAVYVLICLICMPYMYNLVPSLLPFLVCLICMPYMPYMYALYVCLI
jgi:hypothetical protein